MAGVVKSMDATLRSMNLEKVKKKLLDTHVVSFKCKLFLWPYFTDFCIDGQIWTPVWNSGCSNTANGRYNE